jgi:hypothetical protein
MNTQCLSVFRIIVRTRSNNFRNSTTRYLRLICSTFSERSQHSLNREWSQDSDYLRTGRSEVRILTVSRDFLLPRTIHTLLDLGLLIGKISRTHSDTPHPLGLPWTSDQPVAETSIWQHTTLTRETSMFQWRFEPAIPGSKRPQTDASRLRGYWDRRIHTCLPITK